MRITSFLLLLLICTISNAQKKDEHLLEFKINGIQNDTVYLANYYGDKLYYRDTAIADANGSFQFTEEYDGGIYAVVVPGPKYFEFLMNEPAFSMETDIVDFNKNMKIHGSKENSLFFDYIDFLATKNKEAEGYKNDVRLFDDARKTEAKDKLDKIDGEVKAYQRALIENNPGTFVSSVINMSMDIEIPEELKDDTSKAGIDIGYKYYLMHYWDNVDLSDDKIVRTSVFHRKLDTYFKTTIVQVSDSITAAVDRLLEHTKPNSEIRKYVVHFVTYTFETSDIMGLDAVFVHMGLNYYCPDENGVSPAWWMTDEKIEKLCERANKLAPLRLGQKAPYLSLPDTTEKNWVQLWSLEGPYTILYFWDPNCGHCKKETPVLLELYHSELKEKGIEVYSVGKATGDDFEDWKEYIVENDLDWINVGLTKNVFNKAQKNSNEFIPRYTTIGSLNYTETYDIYSTPRVFILDQDMIIRAKGISVEQISELLQRFEEKKEEE